MPYKTSTSDSASWFLKGELSSKSTLPLLSYLIAHAHGRAQAGPANRGGSSAADNVSAARPKIIPDESQQLQVDLVNLIKNGPKRNPNQKVSRQPKVTVVGAGISGLCAGYELKKAGFDVTILEASSRVGGRIKTFREPTFAPGLHGEGGAMRIPHDHFLVHKHLDDFKLSSQLFDFEMENKFIYLSGYKKTITYKKFNELLKAEDQELLKLFPELKPSEKGKTCDELFASAVKPVVDEFWEGYGGNPQDLAKIDWDAVIQAYDNITAKYDKYSLRSYLTDVASWSNDALKLYDLGNAHVVFENGFIESFKDSFLSSNEEGAEAEMRQLQNGMDALPMAFISPKRGKFSLIDNITFGARVTAIGTVNPTTPDTTKRPVKVTYEESTTSCVHTVKSDYLILAIPYTSQRLISKSQSFLPKRELAIKEVRYVEVTKVLLQYKSRWWEQLFLDSEQGNDGGVVSDLPIRYTMFPKKENNTQFAHSKRGVVMAAYTFEQDATMLGALSPEHRIRMAAKNLDTIFPEAKSLDLLEGGASQVFSADEFSGGSAFCYFGPRQKANFLKSMTAPDWNKTVFFAGEQASFTHGWIQGALEAGLRCVHQVWDTEVPAGQ
ncbi:hypothetical protein CHU98_g8605 [Xylaria longipes]|nr:hypothetical protein CHU98_g8605 [Xylaria longipes]